MREPASLKRNIPLLIAGLVFATTARAEQTLGVRLPPKAVKVDRNLYRSPLSYEATLHWMARSLSSKGASVQFESAVDLPDVVSAHVASPRSRTRWEGVNVSQYGGKVWIFIIQR